MDPTITHIRLHTKGLDGDTKFFAFNNTEGEQEPFVFQYVELQELVSQVKLAEPVIKEGGRECYVLRSHPRITLDFISDKDKESIVLGIESSKKKLGILNGIATVMSSDDEDDYEIGLGEFIEGCLKLKDVPLDPFVSVTEMSEGKVLFSAMVSE